MEPLGDAALLVTFGETVDRATNARVHAAARTIAAADIAGVTDVAPAYATLAVYFDRARVSYASVARAVEVLLEGHVAGASGDAGEPAPHGTARAARLIEIPVIYDGEDLDAVARATELTTAEVVARHAGREYVAYMLGFTPGFAYLGELDLALVLPRRATPRPRVPAGSVAIAGAQTAVYPAATPGGWHLIGRTRLVLFDAERDPPALVRPGDRVRFVVGAR